MFKKQLDYLSEKLSLEFWICTILVIMMVGSIIIIFHINNRFANLVTFIGSLIGGLITLISVSLTNRYYSQEKLKQDKENKIELIEQKIKTLKYLYKEALYNIDKAQEFDILKNPIRNEMFQTLVYEVSKNLILEIFIECEQDLKYITKFYYDIKDFPHASGYVSCHGKDETIEWIENIITSINNSLTNYNELLIELR